MHRTGTADLVLPGLHSDEAEQVEDVSHRDHGSNFSKADTRHGNDRQARARAGQCGTVPRK